MVLTNPEFQSCLTMKQEEFQTADSRWEFCACKSGTTGEYRYSKFKCALDICTIYFYHVYISLCSQLAVRVRWVHPTTRQRWRSWQISYMKGCYSDFEQFMPLKLDWMTHRWTFNVAWNIQYMLTYIPPPLPHIYVYITYSRDCASMHDISYNNNSLAWHPWVSFKMACMS